MMMVAFALVPLFSIDITLRKMIWICSELRILFDIGVSILVYGFDSILNSISKFLGHILNILNFLRILEDLSPSYRIHSDLWYLWGAFSGDGGRFIFTPRRLLLAVLEMPIVEVLDDAYFFLL